MDHLNFRQMYHKRTKDNLCGSVKANPGACAGFVGFVWAGVKAVSLTLEQATRRPVKESASKKTMLHFLCGVDV